MSKKVLITGVSGFVGSHLAAFLLKHTDWTIYGLDKASSARLDEIGAWETPRFKFIIHNLASPVPSCLSELLGGVELVINLASESHVDRSIASPADFVRNNVLLMISVLEFCRHHPKNPHLIHFSTDEVYGPSQVRYDVSGHWLEEAQEGDPHRPRNPYAASKACQEDLAMSYVGTYGTAITVLNSMNVWGDFQDAEKFIPKCIAAFLEGRAIEVHGGGTPWESGSRHWINVEDVCRAILMVAENKPSHFQLNIAGELYSNLEIAQLVAAIVGELSPTSLPCELREIDGQTARPGHDLSYALSDELIRTTLGWDQEKFLINDLPKVVQFYIQNPQWLKSKLHT